MKIFSYLIIPVLLLCLWQVATSTGSIPPVLLPTPRAVYEAFAAGVTDGTLLTHITSSAKRSLTGFAIASVCGVLIGYLFAKSKTRHRAGYFLMEAFRVTPPLALIPVLILWLGLDEAPKVAIVFLSSFFPIYMNTLTAVSHIEPRLLEVSRMLHFNAWEEFRMLTLPAALPSVLTGLRLGFGYSWRALVGAELIAASSGLGFLISESAEFLKTDLVFVGIFVIVVLGIFADWVLRCVLQAILTQQHPQRRN